MINILVAVYRTCKVTGAVFSNHHLTIVSIFILIIRQELDRRCTGKIINLAFKKGGYGINMKTNLCGV